MTYSIDAMLSVKPSWTTNVPADPNPNGPITANLAATLVRIRARSQLTQAQVAKEMGTTQTAIARLGSGRQSPNVQTLQNFARANGYCLEIGFIGAPGADAPTGCILVIEDRDKR